MVFVLICLFKIKLITQVAQDWWTSSYRRHITFKFLYSHSRTRHSLSKHKRLTEKPSPQACLPPSSDALRDEKIRHRASWKAECFDYLRRRLHSHGLSPLSVSRTWAERRRMEGLCFCDGGTGGEGLLCCSALGTDVNLKPGITCFKWLHKILPLSNEYLSGIRFWRMALSVGGL